MAHLLLKFLLEVSARGLFDRQLFFPVKGTGSENFGDFLLSLLCQTGLNNGLIKSDLS